MRLALAQFKTTSDHASCVARGLRAVEQAAGEGAALIVFPELSFTPFYPQYKAPPDVASLAEPIRGSTVTQFQEAAACHGIVTIINLFERDGDQTYDTSPVIDADGTLLGVSRMLHITDYECFYERGYYQPGDKFAPAFNTKAGRIGVVICYDRHFPEQMRSLAVQDVDLVLIPQAGVSREWPDGMYEAEIQVASFHNGFFCALANRTGHEGALDFCGGSIVTDPWGRIVTQAPYNEEHLLFADIDLKLCQDSPARKLFLRDRRPDIYESGTVKIAADQDA